MKGRIFCINRNLAYLFILFTVLLQSNKIYASMLPKQYDIYAPETQIKIVHAFLKNKTDTVVKNKIAELVRNKHSISSFNDWLTTQSLGNNVKKTMSYVNSIYGDNLDTLYAQAVLAALKGNNLAITLISKSPTSDKMAIFLVDTTYNPLSMDKYKRHLTKER